MRVVMYLGAILALLVGGFGFAIHRSDIQLIIAFVGTFSGLIMLGLASIMGQLDRR